MIADLLSEAEEKNVTSSFYFIYLMCRRRYCSPLHSSVSDKVMFDGGIEQPGNDSRTETLRMCPYCFDFQMAF